MTLIKRPREPRLYSELDEFESSCQHLIMFSDRRRLRQWAAQVLLVWLFGLAMGVVNACALGESAQHLHHHEAVAASMQKHRLDAGTVVLEHHHDDEQDDAAKVNCQDFCEKSSIGAPPLKVVDDGFAAFGVALPASDKLTVPGWTESIAVHLVIDYSPHLPGGPPPRIAFQRLAL